MTALQWSLLVLGVGVAILLVASNLRERRALKRALEQRRSPPRVRTGDDVGDRTGDGFDEFGVGAPRTARPAAGPPPPAAADPDATISADTPDKVIALYIAEHEGTSILGRHIHAALADQGLVYGEQRIYRRLDGGEVQFRVASLLSPGHLDPADAEDFTTPGLSVFLVLPGPSRPLAAFDGMLDTARALARQLRAGLYDSVTREVLTPPREAELRESVRRWAEGRVARRVRV